MKGARFHIFLVSFLVRNHTDFLFNICLFLSDHNNAVDITNTEHAIIQISVYQINLKEIDNQSGNNH